MADPIDSTPQESIPSAQENIDKIYQGEQPLDNYYPATPLIEDVTPNSIKNNIISQTTKKA